MSIGSAEATAILAGMTSSPIFDSPLVRAFLRSLLFTATLEAVFYRLLTIPSGPGRPGWLSALHASTGRAGVLMFFVAFLVLLPTLISIAYATLRHPAWPPAINGLVSVGLLMLASLAVAASIGPRGAGFALGFSALGLILSLAMLAGYYERCGSPQARAFAVALAGALLCLTLAEAGGLLATLHVMPRAPVLTGAALSGGMWLLFGSGVLAFLAYGPEAGKGMGAASRAATYALPAATAFGLVFGITFRPEIFSRLAQLPGAGGGFVPGILRTGSAAAATFLVGVTVIRGIGIPRMRALSTGLVFLVLSGYPREVAYQHLLSVLGVILITGLAPPPRTRTVAVSMHRPDPAWSFDPARSSSSSRVQPERMPPGDG